MHQITSAFSAEGGATGAVYNSSQTFHNITMFVVRLPRTLDETWLTPFEQGHGQLRDLDRHPARQLALRPPLLRPRDAVLVHRCSRCCDPICGLRSRSCSHSEAPANWRWLWIYRARLRLVCHFLVFKSDRSGQMLTCRAQVPCDSRSLRNRTDSMPSTCVRFEQQDLPGEEEERLKDKDKMIPVDGTWQGE
jgi:hypothetical protein